MKTKVKNGKYTKRAVWDRAAKLELWRSSPYPWPTPPEKLELGVNYFIAMLEQLGAKTTFSCEGHPNGFYVSFAAPYMTALKVEECGYFAVEIEGKNRWSIRINREETKNGLIDCLRWASTAWEKRLGPLDWKKIRLGEKGEDQ
jgi:hypothetical protein